jgi:hypothetical protein
MTPTGSGCPCWPPEIITSLDESPIHFQGGWDALKKEVR